VARLPAGWPLPVGFDSEGMMTSEAEIERVWEDFWKELLCGESGKVDMQKVKADLYDYHFILGEVSKVYDHVSGGRISKPNTHADAVLGEHDDQFFQKNFLEEEECPHCLTHSCSSFRRWAGAL